MNQSQIGFGLKCSRSHQASNLCYSSKCKTNAIMCAQESCQCYKEHIYCPNTIPLNKLKLIFDRKSQSLLPLLNVIYESLWRHSKQVNIQMENISKKIENQEMKLSESQRKLYSLLISKHYEGILPKVVNEAMSSLEKEPEHDISQRVIDAQKQLDKKEQELKRMLEDIRGLGKIKETVSQSVNNTIDFKFSPTLQNNRLNLINQKTVRGDFSPFQCHEVVFLEPNILSLNCKRCRIQLRINKSLYGGLMFGVYQLSPNIEPTWTRAHKYMYCGSINSSDNIIYLGSKEVRVNQSNSISKFQQQDIIEIEYEKESKRVTVTNVTQNTLSISNIKTRKSLPLHFIVLLYSSYNQVEVIKGEIFD